MRNLYLLIIALFVFFSACTSSSSVKPRDPSAMPLWTMQPNLNGKIGAVGVAGRTYDQSISSQRKLAIQRALDELSLQQGVKVELRMQKEEIATNSEATTKLHSIGNYTTNNTVTANIQEVWMDRNSNELYVWMVLDN